MFTAATLIQEFLAKHLLMHPFYRARSDGAHAAAQRLWSFLDGMYRESGMAA